MPRFLIRRNVPDADQEDIDAAAFRALVCTVEYPGLRWIESHWDRESGALFCIYEGASTSQVFEHARRSRIACDSVVEVQSVRPEDYVEITRGVTPDQVTHA